MVRKRRTNTYEAHGTHINLTMILNLIIQGYDTFYAEFLDKTWNDRMEDFMNRTKSKDGRPDLCELHCVPSMSPRHDIVSMLSESINIVKTMFVALLIVIVLSN